MVSTGVGDRLGIPQGAVSFSIHDDVQRMSSESQASRGVWVPRVSGNSAAEGAAPTASVAHFGGHCRVSPAAGEYRIPC